MPGLVTPQPRPRARCLRVAAGSIAIALAATFVAGCNNARIADELHPRHTDYSRRHPIIVTAETATLDVPYGAEDKGAAAKVYVETTRFMRNYRSEGRGPIQVAVPAGASHGAYRQLQNVRLAASRAGVPSQSLRIIDRSGAGMITLSYDRIAAIGPTCGDWSEDVTRNPDFLPYNNFGCATQRNIAAMAANPTDLMYPAQESARGSDTRAADNKNFNNNIGKMIPGAFAR